MAAVEAHESALFARLLDGLTKLDHVTMYGKAARRAPTAFFNVAGVTPRATAEFLASRGVNVWDGDNYAYELCTALGLEPDGAVRAGLVHYNDAPDGHGLAGAVVLTRWAADYAAVGMMLVAARYERRGLGRALLEHLLRAAGDDATVTLFATDMGRPLYEKLGFRPVRRSVSFMGRFRPPPAFDNSKKREAPRLAGSVRGATAADLPDILALDRVAFGGDRGQFLTRLPAFADQIAVFEVGGPAGPGIVGPGIAGYAAAWRNSPDSTVIGPLVAPDGEAAKLLVAALAAGTRTPVRLDPDRPELPGWAHAHGLEPHGRTVVMAHGDLAPRGNPGHLFTPISVALA
jgi:GNAT superfamily N-acetyltransferase